MTIDKVFVREFAQLVINNIRLVWLSISERQID